MGYFESFYARTQPLGSLSKIYAKLGDFEARFRAGDVPGWADEGIANGDAAANGLDMTAFATVEEVESLGEPPESPTLPDHPLSIPGMDTWNLKVYEVFSFWPA